MIFREVVLLRLSSTVYAYAAACLLQQPAKPVVREPFSGHVHAVSVCDIHLQVTPFY